MDNRQIHEMMLREPSWCGCCDTSFSLGEVPRAFIVWIPTERDPEKVTAHAIAACSECSKHDDKWIVDQGVRWERPALATARSGDPVH